MSSKTKSNEIHITRVYDAPVEAVWDAWTDPEQVKQWWGPRGFTITTHSKDLRPGGMKILRDGLVQTVLTENTMNTYWPPAGDD